MRPGTVRRWGFWRWAVWMVGLAAWGGVGCQSSNDVSEVGVSMGAYRDQMLVQEDPAAPSRSQRGTELAQPVASQPQLPPRAALMTQPTTMPQPAPEDVLVELPDPQETPRVLRERLERLKAAPRVDVRLVRSYENMVADALEELKAVEKPRQVRLSLAECVQRALQHNYAIRYEGYNPAISQTQLVEAEAAFDAEFFLDWTYDQRDRAVFSQLQTSKSDTRSLQGGFRQLLPTGMQVSTGLSQQRTASDFQFQTLNPAFDSGFNVAFTQPLLRNFGLDVNRAQINIRRAQLDVAHEKFVQTVRDRLLDVETAYWRVMQVRRTAAILAEQVAQNRGTYLNMIERQAHDATEVELANSESRWRTRQVQYQEAVKLIRDAEDLLKNLINDPEFLLSEDIEIIPTETPFAAALSLDQLAAVRLALEKRSEIRQARRSIDEARIGTAYAKNQTLPQLDLTFQYDVGGIGNTADNSFDNLTTNRFISYTVKVQFAYPFGNRARRAAYLRANLQESQAVVALHQTTDTVVQEVNAAVRTLTVRYAQLPPQLQALRAAERNLRALQARAQRVDPTYLETELSALEQVLNARRTLLQVVTDYNIGIVELEKAKGTLLEYNNIVVTDAPRPR